MTKDPAAGVSSEQEANLAGSEIAPAAVSRRRLQSDRGWDIRFVTH